MKSQYKFIVWACALSFPTTLGYLVYNKAIASRDDVPNEQAISKAIEHKRKQIQEIEDKTLVANGEVLKLQEAKDKELTKLRVLRTELDTILATQDKGSAAEAAERAKRETANVIQSTSQKIVKTKMGTMLAIPLSSKTEVDESTFKSISTLLKKPDAPSGIYISGTKNNEKLLNAVRNRMAELDYDVPRLETSEYNEDSPAILIPQEQQEQQEELQ